VNQKLIHVLNDFVDKCSANVQANKVKIDYKSNLFALSTIFAWFVGFENEKMKAQTNGLVLFDFVEQVFYYQVSDPYSKI